MKSSEVIRLPSLPIMVSADVREVLKELHGRVHVFARVKLSGWHFPERAPEPFMLIGQVVSTRVEITQDLQTAKAYFDEPLPRVEQISFGYGKVISWDFNVAVDPKQMRLLDRARLPKDVIDPFHGS